MRTHTLQEVEDTLRAVGVPVDRVLNVKDIVESERAQARGLAEGVWVSKSPDGEGEEGEDGEWTVKMSKLELGRHNQAVLIGELGLNRAEFARLQEQGVIGK